MKKILIVIFGGILLSAAILKGSEEEEKAFIKIPITHTIVRLAIKGFMGNLTATITTAHCTMTAQDIKRKITRKFPQAITNSKKNHLINHEDYNVILFFGGNNFQVVDDNAQLDFPLQNNNILYLADKSITSLPSKHSY